MSRQQDRSYRGPIQVPVVPIETRAEPVKIAPKHRQCPLCFTGMGGVGSSTGIYRKGSTYAKRYYCCNKCGHTWTVDIQPSQVIDDSADEQ